MLFSVTKNKVVLSEEEKVNEGEYKATLCQFEFDDIYTGLVMKAVFTNSSRGSYEVPILNDRCEIPAEVLQSMGNIKVGVYGYEVDGDELVLRYSPSPTFVKVDSGSYVSNPMNPEEITPTQFEQYMQAMNDGLEEVENVNIDATKEGHTATVTITNRDGQTKSVEILDGAKGEKGDRGEPGPRGYTNVSAGNAIQIDTEDDNRISADIYPADYFTASGQVSAKGTSITLNNTIALGLDSVEICGDMDQNGTPTPDTPVDIDVVTGEQTITVGDGESQSQSYTVDLGSIKLCKIGTYQDYIYFSGSDWYVHKEVEKVVLEGSYGGYNGTDNWFWIGLSSYNKPNTVAGASLYSDSLTYYQRNVFLDKTLVGCSIDSATVLIIRNTAYSSTADYKAWLASNNVTIYYPLATPTNTKITDSSLIQQLEALAKAQAYDGQTNIGVTASGTNLPAILSVMAYRKSLAGMAKAMGDLMGQALTPEAYSTLLSYITNATPYSTTATYEIGDYVIYNSAIYQCNTVIVGGEAWTAEHWDAVASLQQQLDDTETWTFTLSDSTTVTKKVVVR